MRRVAWLIAVVAVVMGIAFLPLATLGAGLSFSEAVVFAVGLIAGLVPEGLLPVITLALALGARGLVRRGAVVKRLSAVETLGSTDVICTDKTGTLTENRMQVVRIWTTSTVSASRGHDRVCHERGPLHHLARVMVACNNAELATVGPREQVTPPRSPARSRGGARRARRRGRPRVGRAAASSPSTPLKLMSTIDDRDGALWVDTKGAPEALLAAARSIATPTTAGSGR